MLLIRNLFLSQKIIKEILATTFFSSILALSSAVNALPEAEIALKLKPIDAYIIVDEDKQPLVSKGKSNSRVVGIFFSRKDAELFLAELSEANSVLAQANEVTSVSLKDIYLWSKSNQSQQQNLTFAYLPEDNAVKSFEAINKFNQRIYKKPSQDTSGVPLFFARYISDNKFLTITDGKNSNIPLYFEPKDLLQLILDFEKKHPEQAGLLKVEVTTLSTIVKGLEKNDSDLYQNISLIADKNLYRSEDIDLINYTGEGLSAPQKLLVAIRAGKPDRNIGTLSAGIGVRSLEIGVKLKNKSCFAETAKVQTFNELTPECQALTYQSHESKKLVEISKIGEEKSKKLAEEIDLVYKNHADND